MSLVFTFSGQGSQREDMLDLVPISYLQKVKNNFDIDLSSMMGNTMSTIEVQLSLFLLEVFQAEQLMAAGYIPEQVAGHSVGIFAAAVVSGALSFDHGLQLVYLRAKTMSQLFPSGYGMGAIIGLSRDELTKIVEPFERQELLFIANHNAPYQFVISGSDEVINTCFEQAKTLGASKVKLLAISTPSHCQLMRPVGEALAEYSQKVQINDTQIDYLCNNNARSTKSGRKIQADLIKNVYCPVLWDEMMGLSLEKGGTIFVELGTGNTLTRLVKKASPSLITFSMDEVGISGADYLLGKWLPKRAF